MLSAELGETVTFRTADAFGLVQRLVKAGFPAGMAELLVTREWAIMAGENERTTTTVRDLTGREPRTIEEFLHENLDCSSDVPRAHASDPAGPVSLPRRGSFSPSHHRHPIARPWLANRPAAAP